MIKIDLTSAEKRKPILGFGTSACWWSQNVADKNIADELAALLYGKSGLRNAFVKIENGKVTNYFQIRNSPFLHHHALTASSCPPRCPCWSG